MNQKDVETLNLKDPNIAWTILTPSPHLTDYPVDDLHALYLVYVGQCWQPALSRTQSAWRREHTSDDKFKYAVIDARFEYKGRSLYERAILNVGNEAAIAEEILNGTAPTYYALKPEGTDSTLLIHAQGQEIPREIRVPGGSNIHEIAAGVLNALGPRKYHQVSVRYHTGVSVFKLMAEGAANPHRLTKRQLNPKGKDGRIGWEIPFDAEEPDPILPYGYWIDRSGALIPVKEAGEHEAVAATLLGTGAAAVREGYFRVVMDIPKRTILFEVTLTRISPTLNQISTLETLARNYDWSLFDAGSRKSVDLSLSHHDIVESLKSAHSGTSKY
jgi:hypothetical protein